MAEEDRCRTIGQRYELCAEIASGGMATVHLARQIGAAGFARIVAVKRLHERFARDPDFVAMFLDEARIVARIRHPNVVSTIDVVVEGSELFIVMEYVHGESFLRLIANALREGLCVPPKIAGAIIAGALHGLHDAHEACGETGTPLGIVHRDVSPHNILVGIDGIARVLDFGVAKASQRITSTLQGTIKGKLSFMAPEQLQGAECDRRADVYAASVVLWEALSGTKLFQGPSEATVIQRILTGTINPPSLGNGAVPAMLDAVVLRGLARDPNARYATAREMALAIEQAVSIATPAEVSAFLRDICKREIDTKAQIISAVEARSSSRNLQEAAISLRSMTVGSSGSTSGTSSSSASSGPFAARQPFHAAQPPAGSISTSAPTYPSLPPQGQAAQIQTFPPPGAADRISASPLSVRRETTKRVFVAVTIAVSTFCLVVGAALVVFARRDRAAASAASVSAVVVSSPAVAAVAPAAPVAPGCPEGMAAVPGGHFFMGSDDDLAAEKPAHNVTLHAYCMDKHEVTAADYRACSDRGECKRAGQTNRWEGITTRDSKTYDSLCNINATDTRGTHPINCVDWAMADRYCHATGGKRLPTEAEWEFAARGSDGRKFPWGDALPTSKHLNACGSECVGWLKKHGAQNDGFLFADDDGFATTAPVGSFPAGASRWGIEDLVGNVWEWVSDYYGVYHADDQSDPNGPLAGKERVIRGGAWNGAYADWVRPTYRYQSAPDTRSHGIGFRCVK